MQEGSLCGAWYLGGRMTTATELLTRALDKWDAETASWSDLFEEIRTFLAAEPEAEPVAWIKRQYAGTGNVLTSIFYCPEPGAIPLYTKPAEPEAETIETLKAENFKLASGQCTEGGPWGDKGGTPYCKYAARKPMTNEEIIQGVTVDTSDDFHAGYWAGIRFAEKHHDITDADV